MSCWPRPETVEELISIESAIADTQYSIDSYETRQRTIDRQVDMSEVDVYLREDSPVEIASEMSLGERISRCISDLRGGLWPVYAQHAGLSRDGAPRAGADSSGNGGGSADSPRKEKEDEGKGDEGIK